MTPGQPSAFVVSGFPSATVAGQANTFAVSVFDAYGNAVTGYRGTVHFTSSDRQAILPIDYTFTFADQGSHTFGAVLRTAGRQSLRATDRSAPAVTGSQHGIVVSPTALSGLAVAGFPSPDTAGNIATFTVRAVDAYGNTVSGYTGTVTFTSSDPQAVLPDDYAFQASDHGRHTFAAVLKTAGPQSLTAADTDQATLTGTQEGIVVNPGKTKALQITAAPSSVSVGDLFTFTVQAVDAYGNVETGFADTVRFSSGDSTATLPAAYAFGPSDAGAQTFGAAFNNEGKQVLRVTDEEGPSLTATVTIDVLA